MSWEPLVAAYSTGLIDERPGPVQFGAILPSEDEDPVNVRLGTFSQPARESSWKTLSAGRSRRTAPLCRSRSAEQIIRLSEEMITRDRLTTLMVTHSMHQAANLGDRLIMMYRGRVIHDFRGAEKRRLRVDDLLARFEEVRRGEQLDESAAALLRRAYV